MTTAAAADDRIPKHSTRTQRALSAQRALSVRSAHRVHEAIDEPIVLGDEPGHTTRLWEGEEAPW